MPAKFISINMERFYAVTTNLNSATRERYIKEKHFILSSKFLKLSTFKGKCSLYTYFRVLHIFNFPVDNLDHSILVTGIITDPILPKGPCADPERFVRGGPTLTTLFIF